MIFKTFVTVEEASKRLGAQNCLFVDCNFSSANEQLGIREYNKSHIPNAVYLDLNKDLSGKPIPNVSGRHPLPSQDDLVALFSKTGIDSTVEVIIYDSGTGEMAAARLWWLLNWAGHTNAAVLTGGKNAWANAGLPLDSEAVETTPKKFGAMFANEYVAKVDEVVSYTASNDPEKYCLIDSRAHDRYLGIQEPIDRVAGHIPSAISRPFQQCITSTGTIAGKETIANFFKDEVNRENVIFYCGSGVTACFNILLFVYAFDKFPRLYPGSWSEWIQNPERKIERQ